MNVLFCDVGVYDIHYQYLPPSQFTVLDKRLSSNQVASYLTHTLVNW